MSGISRKVIKCKQRAKNNESELHKQKSMQTFSISMNPLSYQEKHSETTHHLILLIAVQLTSIVFSLKGNSAIYLCSGSKLHLCTDARGEEGCVKDATNLLKNELLKEIYGMLTSLCGYMYIYIYIYLCVYIFFANQLALRG